MKKEIENLLKNKDYESLLDIPLNSVLQKNLKVCDTCMNTTGHTREYCHKGHKLKLLNYKNPITLRQLFYYDLMHACYLLAHLDGIKKKYKDIYRKELQEIYWYYGKKYSHDRIIGGYWEKKYFKRSK